MMNYTEYLNNTDYDLSTEKLFSLPFNTRLIKPEIKGIVDGVYHCSNERLNSYFKDLNLKESRIATVGSSGDQTLNALFYGAKDITIIDANILSKPYIEYKIAMIKNLDFATFKLHLGKFSMFNWKIYAKISHDLPRDVQQFFDELMLNQDDNGRDFDEGYLTDSLIRNNLFHTPCNDYDKPEENLFFNNENDYKKLKEILVEKNFKINYIIADITKFPHKLTGKFDYIFLSNIYNYYEDVASLNKIIKQLYSKINVGGAIQYNYVFFKNDKSMNLISKLAKLKELPSTIEKDVHLVYFLEKDKKSNSLDLNI